MKKLPMLIICCVFLSTILSSCVNTPNSVEQDGVIVADRSDVQGETSKQDISDDDILTQNQSIIEQSSNKRLEDTIIANENKKIIVNANVNVDNIKTVSSYQYLIKPISDAFRTSLFSSYFGDNASKAEFDARNGVWKLPNSAAIGDYYLYSTYSPKAGETISEEESFSLEYRKVDLYPFDDNLLTSLSYSKVNLSVEEAVKRCDKIIEGIAELSEYQVDYIHAYGNNGRRPYYKIAYKRMVDAIPVTGYNDIYFLVDSDGIQKISGSFFDVVETTSQHSIMDIDEAFNIMKKNAGQIDLDKDTVNISEITLEYIVTKSIDGSISLTPSWRFQIGNNEDEINLYRDYIIAIDAINGEIIQGRRGDTF